jgi:hypothetical protein
VLNLNQLTHDTFDHGLSHRFKGPDAVASGLTDVKNALMKRVFIFILRSYTDTNFLFWCGELLQFVQDYYYYYYYYYLTAIGLTPGGSSITFTHKQYAEYRGRNTHNYKKKVTKKKVSYKKKL